MAFTRQSALNYITCLVKIVYVKNDEKKHMQFGFP